MTLFTRDLTCWADWSNVFQSAQAFTPLAMHILKKEGLPALPLVALPPGTNAVFSSGSVVLKIYAPVQTGLQSDADVANEATLLRLLGGADLPVPQLLAQGEVADRYRFPYLIMPYLKGIPGGDAFNQASPDQAASLMHQLHALLAHIHRPFHGMPFSAPQTDPELAASRVRGLSPQLLCQMDDYAKKAAQRPHVLVHGDMTQDNTIVDGQNRLHLIDFADCREAPACYELPCIVWDLLGGNPALVRLFAASQDPETFVDDLLLGLCLHDFRGGITLGSLRIMKTDPGEVTGLSRLRALTLAHLFGQHGRPV